MWASHENRVIGSENPLQGLARYRSELIIVLLITAVALFARLYRLGELGLRLDEDLFGVAVRAILESGEPLFPTGLDYRRSELMLYLTAGLARVFGSSEFVLRLPAALLGTAVIPVAYLFLRRLQGVAVAVVAALVLALAPWELDLTRYARMYGPLSFFYLLTAYACYRGLLDGRSRWILAAVLAGPLTITVHQLGFTVALFFLLPLLIADRVRTSPLWMLGGAVLSGGTFLAWQRYIDAGFAQPYLLNGGAESQTVAPADQAGAIEQVLEPFNFPPLDLFSQLLREQPMLFALITLAAAAVTVGLLRGAWRERSWSPVFLALLALCCYFHQLTLGMVVFCAWLYSRREGLDSLAAPCVWAVIGAVGAVFLMWCAYGTVYGEPNRYVLEGRSTQLVQTAKLFLSYPGYRITWGYLLARPVMSVFALLGILLCLDRGSRGINERKNLFLLLAFTVPLLTNGVFDSTQRFRYNFHLDVFYYGLFAVGLLRGPQALLDATRAFMPRIADWRGRTYLRWGWIGAGLAAVLITDLSPAESWRVVSREYGDSSRTLRQLGLPFYPDHKTAGEYVRRNLENDDIVVTMDWIQQYYYAGRTDYLIRTAFFEHWSWEDAEGFRDIYTGSRLVPSLDALLAVLDAHRDRRIWLISSPRRYGNYTLITREIVEFLESQEAAVVHIGEDGRTRVYLFEPDQRAAPLRESRL